LIAEKTFSAVKRQVKHTAKAEEQHRKLKEAAGKFYFSYSLFVVDKFLARSNGKKPSKKRVASPLSQPMSKKPKGSLVGFLDTMR